MGISMTMSDLHKFLNSNQRLKEVIEKINILQRCETKISRKHNGFVQQQKEEKNGKNNKEYSMILYFDDEDYGMLDLIEEFEKLHNAMSDTIRCMNRHCSTLQELYQIKSKLGKQLVKFVKYHWK